MANAPDVSVIIPTYRREDAVVAAVKSALDQGELGIEVLVLDDTPEGTARAAVEGLGEPRVRYLVQSTPSKGRPALVRNDGIQLARGRYLYFLDDDDLVFQGALPELVKALDAHPGRGVAFGTVHPFGPSEEIVRRYKEWFDSAAQVARRLSRSSWLTTGVILFRGTLIINSVCMIRREHALALEGYDPAIPVYEDVEFFNRGIRRFGHVFVDCPVLRYRTGQPSLIHNLKGDGRPIQDSYRMIHSKYRASHGWAEYRALQLVSKLLPLGGRHERGGADLHE